MYPALFLTSMTICNIWYPPPTMTQTESSWEHEIHLPGDFSTHFWTAYATGMGKGHGRFRVNVMVSPVTKLSSELLRPKANNAATLISCYREGSSEIATTHEHLNTCWWEAAQGHFLSQQQIARITRRGLWHGCTCKCGQTFTKTCINRIIKSSGSQLVFVDEYPLEKAVVLKLSLNNIHRTIES